MLFKILGGISHHLHFKRSPEERTNTFGIIVADRFAKVVFITAVTLLILLDGTFGVNLLHGSFYFRRSSGTKTGNGTALCQRDGLISMNLDEILDDKPSRGRR